MTDRRSSNLTYRHTDILNVSIFIAIATLRVRIVIKFTIRVQHLIGRGIYDLCLWRLGSKSYVKLKMDKARTFVSKYGMMPKKEMLLYDIGFQFQ